MEVQFKVAFGALFAVMLQAVVRVARQVRQRPGASINQMANEVPVLRIVRPVLGVVFSLALLDWLLPGTRMGWAASTFSTEVRWVGVAVASASVVLISWSFTALGVNYRGGIGVWDDHELVTSGPYRWVRHPIYVGFVGMMVGLWGLSSNRLIGAAGTLLTLSIPFHRIATEERELRERFGSAYASYARRTPRFIPRLSLMRKERGR